MFLVVRVAGMPGKTSNSGNEWSRGGDPGLPGRKPWAAGEEALGAGRRPWAAGEAAAGRPGGRLGGSGEAPWRGRFLFPRASVGGTTLVAPKRYFWLFFARFR